MNIIKWFFLMMILFDVNIIKLLFKISNLATLISIPFLDACIILSMNFLFRKRLLVETVSANYFLFAETVSANNLFHLFITIQYYFFYPYYSEQDQHVNLLSFLYLRRLCNLLHGWLVDIKLIKSC